jgi:ribulose-phosphate 3-epimerase
MHSVKVVPAILTDDSIELARLVALANKFAPFVQVDIMDGAFVPTRSVGMADLCEQDIRFRWEAHLMVADPLAYLSCCREAGASRVIFHIESAEDPFAVVSQARVLGLEVGVAVNPPTPVADIDALLPVVDSVLLMTVFPGYYGAPFVPEVMSKVGRVRAVCSSVEIGVDGGVKESNLVDVARHGVDAVCVGSAVFASPDPESSYLRLVSLARNI